MSSPTRPQRVPEKRRELPTPDLCVLTAVLWLQLGEAIEALVKPSTPTAEIYQFFLTLNGFGPFSASNLSMLVGRWDTQPFDSETVRLMREFHRLDPRFRMSSAQVLARARSHYSPEKYGRWQFLVYWFEYSQLEERSIVREAQLSTDRAFALVPAVAVRQRTHSQLVAAQTRKRRQGGDSSSSPVKRRAQRLPRASRG